MENLIDYMVEEGAIIGQLLLSDPLFLFGILIVITVSWVLINQPDLKNEDDNSEPE